MSRRRRQRARLSPNRVTLNNPAVHCPNCGARVAASRLREHFEEAVCLVQETFAHLRSRGLDLVVPGSGGRTAVMLRDLREALGEEALVQAPVRVDPRALTPVLGWWAPAWALELVRALEGLDLAPAERRVAAGRALGDPEWAAALQAARALGGRAGARLLARSACPLVLRPKRRRRAQATLAEVFDGEQGA